MIYTTLDRLTRRWWFYLLVVLLFFLPTQAEKAFDPRETPRVLAEAMPNALVYSAPALFPLFKLLPLLAIIALALFGRRAGRAFAAYAGINLLVIAVFQSIAETETFGLVVIWGNLLVYLLVALLWIWEAFTGRNDFSPAHRPLWKYWVVLPALLAFWFPMRSVPLGPDFSLAALLANSAGLTGCMMVPVYLAVMTVIHPKANLPLMRVTAFAGLITGIMNVLQWFVFLPAAWWAGVVHLPLLSVSAYALLLAVRKGKENTAEGSFPGNRPSVRR